MPHPNISTKTETYFRNTDTNISRPDVFTTNKTGKLFHLKTKTDSGTIIDCNKTQIT